MFRRTGCAAVLSLLVFSHAETVSAAARFTPPKEPKVLWVVIDGIRDLELKGKAKDDFGKTVPAESLFPNILSLKKSGLFLPEMKVSNPVGISLPAYGDMFAGRRQEKILRNHPPKDEAHSYYPTIFQVLKEKLALKPNEVALHSSWGEVCDVAATEDGDKDFYKSCGWQPDTYYKEQLYKGSRTDADTFIQFVRETKKSHPRFMFLHYDDGDEEAHFQDSVERKEGFSYGIFHYHKALREDDYLVRRTWDFIQSDPFYKNQTYLIITTDHGRDNVPTPTQWTNHGFCIKKHGLQKLCSGCESIFGIVVGPGVRPSTSKTHYTHVDLTATATKFLGVEMPGATGHPIKEIFGK